MCNSGAIVFSVLLAVYYKNVDFKSGAPQKLEVYLLKNRIYAGFKDIYTHLYSSVSSYHNLHCVACNGLIYCLNPILLLVNLSAVRTTILGMKSNSPYIVCIKIHVYTRKKFPVLYPPYVIYMFTYCIRTSAIREKLNNF